MAKRYLTQAKRFAQLVGKKMREIPNAEEIKAQTPKEFIRMVDDEFLRAVAAAAQEMPIPREYDHWQQAVDHFNRLDGQKTEVADAIRA